jgi:hypothetical protein
LLRKAFEFPHVERRPSAISVPGAQALWLSKEVASARPELFLIGREFAHVHPPALQSLALARTGIRLRPDVRRHSDRCRA